MKVIPESIIPYDGGKGNMTLAISECEAFICVVKVFSCLVRI